VSVARDERRDLADLFDQLGPDQPTLCSGWTTRDLLAHLIVRERRPDAAGGILVAALAKRTEQVQAQIASKPFAELVDTFRGGAPVWMPVLGWPVVADQANLFEFYVHHEDVRRAQPDWEPRPDDGARNDALWRGLKLGARVLLRRSPVGVTLHSADHGGVVAKKGTPSVTLVGTPSEIALIVFGRPSASARVVIEGEAADVASFEAAPRGL
jgi:uncharacterized protein (TIGR03085 family)